MFGYIVTNSTTLSKEERDRYSKYYCGLCYQLAIRYGSIGQATLTYDMTFLAVLLSSLYELEETRKVLVFDLGGGTFVVSVLDIKDGVIEVLATAGNNRLGGDDFDACIVDWLVAEFKREHRVNLSGQPAAMQRLKEAAVQAKKELSAVETAPLHLPFLTVAGGKPLHMDISMSRAKFNALTAH